MVTLTNFYTFVYIGMGFLVYLWLMDWSLKKYIEFRALHRLKKLGVTSTEYTWKEIVSIIIYPLVWLPPTLLVVISIGICVQFIFLSIIGQL